MDDEPADPRLVRHVPVRAAAEALVLARLISDDGEIAVPTDR